MEEILTNLVKGQENQEINLKEIKADILGLTQKVEKYGTMIKQLEQFENMSVTLKQRQPDTLLSNTM